MKCPECGSLQTDFTWDEEDEMLADGLYKALEKSRQRSVELEEGLRKLQHEIDRLLAGNPTGRQDVK